MGKKLYIGNLELSATAQSLKELFSQCGSVLDVKIKLDHKGLSQGFAYVDMGSEEEAALAINKFHGFVCAEISGEKKLTVNLAKPPASRDQRRVLANRRNRGKR